MLDSCKRKQQFARKLPENIAISYPGCLHLLLDPGSLGGVLHMGEHLLLPELLLHVELLHHLLSYQGRRVVRVEELAAKPVTR